MAMLAFRAKSLVFLLVTYPHEMQVEAGLAPDAVCCVMGVFAWARFKMSFQRRQTRQKGNKTILRD